MTHPTHEFTLILDVADINDDLEDALLEARCDDALLGVACGRGYLDFARNAPTLLDAVLSAIRAVRCAGADVLRVELTDLVSASDIAERIGRSRQLIHQYIRGDRGRGDFPAPHCRVNDRSPLWSWRDVAAWLADCDLLPRSCADDADACAAVNTALDMHRRRERTPALLRRIERELRAS